MLGVPLLHFFTNDLTIRITFARFRTLFNRRVPRGESTMPRILLSICLFLFTAIGGSGAQTPASTRARGVVTAVDKDGRKLSVHSDAGSDLTITVDDATAILKATPGTRDLRTAPHITLAEINSGDRVLLSGAAGADPKVIAARTLVVMSKADVASKQEADREKWERGVTGVVKSVDPERKVITVTVRAFGGGHDVMVLADKAEFRRYAPDSVKFSDARPSTLAEIKTGDQLRARGSSSGDHTQFTAEEIVSGSFRNMAATVKSIDTAARTLVVTDLDTKKPVTVHIDADSAIRKMEEPMAERLAMMLQGGGFRRPGGERRAGSEGGAAERRPRAEDSSGEPHSGGFGSPGGERSGRGGMSRMLERLPAITLGDLKPGDALIVASTAGARPGEVTAITMIAGVEPILRAPNRQVMLGNWNVNMNMGGF